jgi:hypothetical protein
MVLLSASASTPRTCSGRGRRRGGGAAGRIGCHAMPTVTGTRHAFARRNAGPGAHPTPCRGPLHRLRRMPRCRLCVAASLAVRQACRSWRMAGGRSERRSPADAGWTACWQCLAMRGRGDGGCVDGTGRQSEAPSALPEISRRCNVMAARKSGPHGAAPPTPAVDTPRAAGAHLRPPAGPTPCPLRR